MAKKFASNSQPEAGIDGRDAHLDFYVTLAEMFGW